MPNEVPRPRRATLLVALCVVLASCGAPSLPSPPGSPTPSVMRTPSAAPGTSTEAWHIATSIALHPASLGVLATQAADGALWVAIAGTPAGHVYRYDLARGTLLSVADVGWAPASLAVLGAQAWIADGPGDGSQPGLRANRVEAIDTTSGRVEFSIPVPAPGQLLAAFDALWITSSGALHDAVYRLNPTTRALTKAIPLPGRVAALSEALGRVWIVTVSGGQGSETLIPLDPATGRPGLPLDLGGRQVTPVVGVDGRLETLTSAASAASGVTLLRIDPATGSIAPLATWTRVQASRLYADGVYLVTGGSRLEVRSLMDGQVLDSVAPVPDLDGGGLIDIDHTPAGYWFVGGMAAVLLSPSQ